MAISNQAILDAFLFRHACKEFDADRRISASDFEVILETARLSPSSFGIEPWQFLVVQNPQLREKLKAPIWGAQKQLPTASHFIIILVRREADMRYDSAFVSRFMREVQQFPEDIVQLRLGFLEKFQKHDFQLLGREQAMFDWSCKQSYIALANMMTAAALMDIDSCPIEGFDREQLEQLLAAEMSIDTAQWGVSVAVALGYRKEPPARPKTRQTQDEVVRWFN